MFKNLVSTGLLLVAVLFMANSANAQYGGYGQYGQYGGTSPSQSIIIDKMVGKVVTTTSKGGQTTTQIQYVDNLGPSDMKFKAGDSVSFQLKVKNTSNAKLVGVTVKDFVPSYLDAVEGPGTFDSNNRTITFNAGDFNIDEEKVYTMKMKVVPQQNLPADKGIICVVNKAQAYNDNANDEDTAQLCIEKQVLGVTQVPSTGPEMALPLMGAQLAMLGAGLFLKKKLS